MVEFNKEAVIEEYVANEPTPENTTELVNDLAERYDVTPNKVRIHLMQSGVYIKKEAKASSSSSGEKKSTRRTKLVAIEELAEKVGAEVDVELLSKATIKLIDYIRDALVK